MSTVRDIELLNQEELSDLSDKELDLYHIKVQNHKDKIHAYMRDTLMKEINKRTATSAESVLNTLSLEQRESLAQYISANGVAALKNFGDNSSPI